MQDLLVILDLDETLVHAADAPLDHPCAFQCCGYSVYLRPGLREFLNELQKICSVAVWTSSGETYATCVVETAFPRDYPLRFFWSAERCTVRFNPETQKRITIKNLHKVKRLGIDLGRVLCVDDSPEKHARNYGNLIRVPEFLGERSDETLPRLLDYIVRLIDVPDVRKIEKRAWAAELSRDR